jgi:hypothetical protein
MGFKLRCCCFDCVADHYAAKLAGLMPADPLAAALADQAYFFVEDILQVRPSAQQLTYFMWSNLWSTLQGQCCLLTSQQHAG